MFKIEICIQNPNYYNSLFTYFKFEKTFLFKTLASWKSMNLNTCLVCLNHFLVSASNDILNFFHNSEENWFSYQFFKKFFFLCTFPINLLQIYVLLTETVSCSQVKPTILFPLKPQNNAFRTKDIKFPSKPFDTKINKV
jgi:hypothetical protein